MSQREDWKFDAPTPVSETAEEEVRPKNWFDQCSVHDARFSNQNLENMSALMRRLRVIV